MAWTFQQNDTAANLSAALTANAANISAADLPWYNLAITAIKAQLALATYVNWTATVTNGKVRLYANGVFDGASTRVRVEIDLVILDPQGNIVTAT